MFLLNLDTGNSSKAPHVNPPPFVNKESAETETVMKDIQRPANILQNTPPVVTKISVPMHTLLTDVMKSNI